MSTSVHSIFNNPTVPTRPGGQVVVTENPAPPSYLWWQPVNPVYAMLMDLLRIASTGLSAYHGYRRNVNGSPILWALVWGGLGAIFPVITPAIAFAEGFGRPAGSKSLPAPRSTRLRRRSR